MTIITFRLSTGGTCFIEKRDMDIRVKLFTRV